jgi:hypothetical protein
MQAFLSVQYLALYLPMACAITLFLYHQFSMDGGASLFAHFGWSYRLPKGATPFVAGLFGAGAAVLQSKQSGSDWSMAVFTGINSTVMGLLGATASHQLQIFQAKKPPTSAIAIASSEPANDAKPPSTPPKGPGPLAGAATILLLLGSLGFIAGNAACKDPTAASDIKSAVKTVLDASDIACINSSKFTTSADVAKDCAIDETLVPAIDQLLAGKAAMKAPTDAGAAKASR